MKRTFRLTVAFLSLVFSVVAPRIANGQGTQAPEAAGDSASQQTIAVASHPASTTPASTSTEAQKYYELGLRMYSAEKFPEALGAFKQASRLQPEHPETQLALGMVQAKLKLYKDAVDSFKNATKLKPDWPEAHFRVGVLSLVLGRRSEAFEAYTTLQRLNSPLTPILNRAIKDEKGQNGIVGDVSAGGEFWTLQPAQPGVGLTSETAPASSPVIKTSTPTQPAALPTERSNNADAPRTASAAPVATDLGLAGNYRIGVGDVLDIRLLNSRIPRSTLYSVVEGGLIDYPVAGGPIAVAGLTADEIQAFIAAELKRRAVEEDARVSVGVRQYASHSVSITGLVNNPGTKFLRREAVPLYVIMAESQARLDAGRVAIMRAGSEVLLDLSEAASLNFLIRAGDLISVTARPEQFYYIGGRVGYPGQKAFAAGITLLQALLAAGGPPRQNDITIEISREDQAGRLTTSRFKLKDIKEGKIPDPRLQPGDRIEVVR